MAGNIAIGGPYDVGARPVLTATYRNIDGTLTSPTTVVFVVKPAGGTKTTYTVGVDANAVTTSTGVFTCTLAKIPTSQAGLRVECYTDGTGNGADARHTGHYNVNNENAT